MQNRRSYLILVGLILAALAGVAALAIPGSPAHKKVNLGVDLQGGPQGVLKGAPAKGQSIIGKAAQLELYDLETSLTGPSVSASGDPQTSPSLDALLSQVQSQA